MVRIVILGALSFALTAGAAMAKEEPKSIPWDDTGPFEHVDGTGPPRTSHEFLNHERNVARLAAMGATIADAVSQDVGDVAVIVDNGGIIIPARPANLFDLPLPSGLSFVPGADDFTVSFSDTSLDPVFGAALPLGDDDTFAVPFMAGFPFLGTTYTTIHVNSDGNISLGVGDASSEPRDAARHVGGPPRVSPLLADLDPAASGSVHADERADRFVVTWLGVPQFGTSNSNTFQATLHKDGGIDFVYEDIDFDFGQRFGVIGVAEGDDEGPINEIDITDDLPDTFGAGAIFEEFNPAVGTQVDIVALMKEFYNTHDDKFDFQVLFTDFTLDLGGDFAFHVGIKNETLGIGRELFDFTPFVGSAGELESFLMMNRIGLYWPDARKLENPPIKKFRFSCDGFFAHLSFCQGRNNPPGPNQITRRARWMGTLQGDFGFGSYTLGLHSAMSIMGQEAGHRWLAFVEFKDPDTGEPSGALLGRGAAHWSFFFNARVPDGQFGGDPRSSSMEGNAILDLGGGLFLTERDELVDGFTELDQYLMGLLEADRVSSFFYVRDPSLPAFVASLAALDDVRFSGTQVKLSVADIEAVEGARSPELGDEDDDGSGTDVKTMAVILLVEQGPPNSRAHAAAINHVDTFRATWQEYANGPATGGLGLFDTSLDPAIH